MSYFQSLALARDNLNDAKAQIQDELRNYPTPVSGCDAQYNYLIGLRGSIGEALRVLEEPRFVATPRTPEPLDGVASR